MESDNKHKYGIKSTFSQCLALTGACFLQIGIGSQVLSLTIIIGAISEEANSPLTMTKNETSWFGSLLYLCTPVGSLLSSLVLNRFGHKNCMIMTNIPYIISQIVFLYAKNVHTMYACSILMGLSIGFSGGPFSAYIGEVCEPKLRGALMSATNVAYFSGALLFTIVYAITRQWRLTVLINMAIPIITIVILYMSPDSPMWLLTKGKTKKAQRTLSKLRGWVSHEKCSNEFQEMVIFTSNTKKPSDEKGGKDDEESSWKQLLEPEVFKPFFLLFVYFFFSNIISGVPYSPYLVEVLKNFGVDMDIQWTLVLSLVLASFAGILTIFFVNILGKRILILSTLMISSLCYISIGVIGIYETNSNQITSWTLLILFFSITFLSSFGIMPIGWILLSEIFPMKSRTITCSLCSTLSFVFGFFMTKYYQDFVALVDFYNTFSIFGIGCLFGWIYFYYYLPETENKTLQEISEFFK